jgi:hypothetical protein
MKILKPLAIAAALAAAVVPAKAAADTDAEFLARVTPVIAQNCSAKWANDYDMQLYCRQKQLKAVNAILDTRHRWLAQGQEKSRDEVAIMDICARKWQWDFDMVVWCFGKQRAALAELHRQDNSGQQPAIPQDPNAEFWPEGTKLTPECAKEMYNKQTDKFESAKTPECKANSERWFEQVKKNAANPAFKKRLLDITEGR